VLYSLWSYPQNADLALNASNTLHRIKHFSLFCQRVFEEEGKLYQISTCHSNQRKSLSKTLFFIGCVDAERNSVKEALTQAIMLCILSLSTVTPIKTGEISCFITMQSTLMLTRLALMKKGRLVMGGRFERSSCCL